MNKVKIEVPKTGYGAATSGSLFCRPGMLSEDVYVLHRVGCQGQWTAVNICTGGYWNPPADTRRTATDGLVMLPPGTVVTITVEEGP